MVALHIAFWGGLFALAAQAQSNSTFFNPVLPGWHSDPSCIRVDDTFYCVTSTFIAFPGLPVYASKDLKNWRQISRVWNRESQLPGVSWNTTLQQDGMWAPTIRYHDNEFWVICEYILNSATLEDLGDGSVGVLFRAADPFSDEAWSDPLIFHPNKIDPDIFWDDDGKAYVATQGIVLQELDLVTGELSQPAIPLWNGTGGVWPEGPHLYKKDGYYYLMIAEGGTAQNHAVTIARSKSITGPYESNVANPILTNRGTDAYFTRVGHGDIFDDENGNWWIIVHASRSGVAYDNMPMGRESVMAPARWDEGEWPVMDSVKGEMEVWPLPEETRDIPGDGYFNGDADAYDWDAASKMPKHFVYWRVPRYENFQFTDSGLQIVPSRANMTGAYTGDIALTGQRGISFVSRRQTETIFNFSVDVSLDATAVGQEAGVTAFLAQENHVDIGLAYLQPCNEEAGLFIRFRAHGRLSPPQAMFRLPADWVEAESVRLHIQARDQESFVLGASLGDGELIELGTAPAELISHLDSARSGTFIGVLVGIYATCNGAGEGIDCPEGGVATFQRWRYEPIAQFIDYERSIPV
ncbi:glycosyl hydrolase [Stachybotrys elegans]|uniref:Glycosyl hydrolase n=1 Tax=Stachybotrys elegans TaxID=80388 RepID=A0A8K0S8K1_9HYPO|nr:glycosyl hydrolase [Stachybotrys elegans]